MSVKKEFKEVRRAIELCLQKLKIAENEYDELLDNITTYDYDSDPGLKEIKEYEMEGVVKSMDAVKTGLGYASMTVDMLKREFGRDPKFKQASEKEKVAQEIKSLKAELRRIRTNG
jgi:hypothetical protein